MPCNWYSGRCKWIYTDVTVTIRITKSTTLTGNKNRCCSNKIVLLKIVSTYLNSGFEINNPDASVGVCCSHKVVAVGFNTLRYDASVGVLNPPHE